MEDEEKLLDLEELCRTCGSKLQSDLAFCPHIFDTFSGKVVASAAVRDLLEMFNFQIAPDDSLPQQMCNDCLETFSAIAEFYQKCRKIQDVFSTIKQNMMIIQEEGADNIDGNTLKCETGTKMVSENHEEPTPFEFVSFTDDETELNENDVHSHPMPQKRNKRRRHRQWKKESCKFCKKYLYNISSHLKVCVHRDVKPCRYCNAEIATAEELKTHIDEKHPDKLFICKVCLEEFPYITDLWEHADVNHRKDEFQCEICDRVLENSMRLSRHRKIFHNIIDLQCPSCGELCETEYIYQCHLRSQHPQSKAIKKRYKCQYCGKGYDRMDRKMNHELKHTGERPFLCDTCGAAFRTVGYLKMHLLHQHSGLKFGRRRRIFGQDIHIQAESSRHAEISNHSEIVTHTEIPSNSKLINNEVGSVHGESDIEAQVDRPDAYRDSGEIDCSCLDVPDFSETNTIEEKQKLTSNDTNSPIKKPKSPLVTAKIKSIFKYRFQPGNYVCDLCGIAMTSAGGLNNHKRAHLGTNITCTKSRCGRRFSNQASLQEHIQTKHTVYEDACLLYKFTCPICSQRFTGPNSLAQHVKTHKENRPFKCKVCGSEFKQPDHLRVHIRRRHVKEKKHACPHCSMRFVQNCELTQHLKVHSDKKPYSCPHCPAEYRWRGSLRTHLRTHSGDKPFKCLICGDQFRTVSLMNRHFSKHPVDEKKSAAEKIVRTLDTPAVENMAESQARATVLLPPQYGNVLIESDVNITPDYLREIISFE